MGDKAVFGVQQNAADCLTRGGVDVAADQLPHMASDGIQGAFRAVFTEGTVIGSFIVVGFSCLWGLFRCVMWGVNRRRAQQWTLERHAEEKRLLEQAERVRFEKRLAAAHYKNPLEHNVHAPGSVTWDEVMGSGAKVAAAPAHPPSSSRPLDGSEPGAFVSSRQNGRY